MKSSSNPSAAPTLSTNIGRSADFPGRGSAAVPQRPIAELPAPRGLPVLGNLHQIQPARLHEILEGWALTRPPAVDAKSFAAPTEFRPERWLAPSGAHEPRAHLPFGSGPRICPGRSLALVELRVVLATLYRSFDVSRAVPASDVREEFSFTMMPAGLRVRLQVR